MSEIAKKFHSALILLRKYFIYGNKINKETGVIISSLEIY